MERFNQLNQTPLRLTFSKSIGSLAFILASIQSDRTSNPSRTSLTPYFDSLTNTGIKFNREMSSGSPVHVEIATPFLGWSLKLDAILSTIIVFDKSLLIRAKSLILT